jgi:lauroyl/myristoyl acyltransferase
MTDWLSYLGTWIGVEGGRLAARAVPTRYLHRLSDAIAGTGFRRFGGFRHRSIRNLETALGDALDGPAIEDIARRSLRSFFRACVELAVALDSSPEQFRSQTALVGREHLEAAAARGRGVIALSAHLGNFLLVGSRLAVEGYSTSVLINQPREGRRARLLDTYRLRVWQRTIHSKPPRDALQELTAVLRANGVVVMIADEYRDSGISVTLFGRPVLARHGAVTLALRTGAALLPMCLVRRPDGTLVLIIDRELELERSSQVRIRENTQRMTEWVERMVRAYPDQWNWMNIRWAAPPDQGPAADQRRATELAESEASPAAEAARHS